MTVQEFVDGKGRWALLCLPDVTDPFFVDLDLPLEDQLPAGRMYLDAARELLAEQS